MHLIIYGILGDDDDGNLFIEGPFFHNCDHELSAAEIQAKELANTKTKNQIIPWVFEAEAGETISQIMSRVQAGWFQRFKERTMETYQTVQKDQTNSTCPFVDVHLENFLKVLTDHSSY